MGTYWLREEVWAFPGELRETIQAVTEQLDRELAARVGAPVPRVAVLARARGAVVRVMSGDSDPVGVIGDTGAFGSEFTLTFRADLEEKALLTPAPPGAGPRPDPWPANWEPEVPGWVSESAVAMGLWQPGDLILYELGRVPGQRVLPIRIAGTYRPRDPGNDAWYLPDRPVRPGEYFREEVYRWMIFIPEEAFWRAHNRIPLPPGVRVVVDWRYQLDPLALEPRAAGAIADRLSTLHNQLLRGLGSVGPGGISPLLSPVGVLKHFDAARRDLSFPLLLFTAPLLAQLAYFLWLTARLTVESSAGEIALLRSRGASALQVVASFAAEAMVLAGAAVAAGPVLGLGMARVIAASGGFLHFVLRQTLPLRMVPEAWGYAGAAGLLGLAVLLLPAVVGARADILSHRRRSSRPEDLRRFRSLRHRPAGEARRLRPVADLRWPRAVAAPLRPRAAAAALILATLLSGCGLFSVEEEPAPPPLVFPESEVPTARVDRGTVVQTLTFSGVVRARQEAVVRFPVAGVVQEVLVRAGDRVEAGQPLVRLQNDDLPRQLRDLRFQIRQAELELAAFDADPSRGGLLPGQGAAGMPSGEGPTAQGAGAQPAGEPSADGPPASGQASGGQAAGRQPASGQEAGGQPASGQAAGGQPPETGTRGLPPHLAIQRQLLELKLEWLRAQEKDLEGMLASTVVVAPFAGVVTSVTEAVPGELVAQNAVAATVADDSGRHVVTRNDDGRLRLLARGQRVEITHGTRQGVAAVTGVIESAPLVAEDLQSAGEVVRIDVTQALDGTAFRLGDPVTVLVEIARAENVLRVPAGALGRRGDRYYVVVQEGGMAREVPIEVGISDGTYYEVRSGLSEGQVVQLLQ